VTLRTILRQRVLPAVAAAFVVALLAAGAWYGYGALASRPVTEVVLGGDVDRLPPQIVAEFTRELERRTVGTSLASVRENAKRIPWVFPCPAGTARHAAYRPPVRQTSA